MSRKCDLCSKAYQIGHKVSHANNKTKIRFMPNLQKVKVMIDKKTQSIRVCMKCLRSGNVIKPIANV